MTSIESTGLTYDQYRQAAGSSFEVTLEAGTPCRLRLTEVSERRMTSGFEAFSLTMAGPVQPPLAQGMYRLVHEQLGAQDLFLVPEHRDAQGMRYQVTFNRTPPAGRSG